MLSWDCPFKHMLFTSHGWGEASLHVRTCTPPPPHLRISGSDPPIVLKCDVSRDPIVTRLTKVGGGMTAQCTFARASPVSLSRKPLSPDIEATPKTDLSLSRSLVHRETWRLTGDLWQCRRTVGATWYWWYLLLSLYLRTAEQRDCFWRWRDRTILPFFASVLDGAKNYNFHSFEQYVLYSVCTTFPSLK